MTEDNTLSFEAVRVRTDKLKANSFKTLNYVETLVSSPDRLFRDFSALMTEISVHSKHDMLGNPKTDATEVMQEKSMVFTLSFIFDSSFCCAFVQQFLSTQVSEQKVNSVKLLEQTANNIEGENDRSEW